MEEEKKQNGQHIEVAVGEQAASRLKDTRIEGSVYEGLPKAIAGLFMGIGALLPMFLMPMNVISEMLCMYGLIVCVRAIGDYRWARKFQRKKPTATLVVAIVAIVLNIIALFFWAVLILHYFSKL